jgi:hypothetical protein
MRSRLIPLLAVAAGVLLASAATSSGAVAPGVVNLGLVGDAIPGELIAVDVPEPAAGSDLNGDGDTIDNVVHVHTGTASTNLRLAGSPALTGSLLAISVSESAQGGTDLNGDGDAGDTVLFVHDGKTGSTTNLRVASSLLVNDGRWIAFLMGERQQGGRDLNGDGDATDEVLQVYDSASGQMRNASLAAPSGFSLVNGRVAIRISEAAQGGRDLNDDGDTADGVLHLYDATTGLSRNVGLAASPRVYDDGRFVAFTIPEREQAGRDLNGDGDAFDTVLHVLDTGNDAVANVGVAVSPTSIQIAAARVAFDVYEPDQRADLNGDGDRSDVVAHLYEAATGTLRNLRLAILGFPLEFDGRAAAFTVSESAQSGIDLNGDGDASDFVVHVFRVADGAVINTRLASNTTMSVRSGLVAVLVNEEQQSHDLNGDGDTTDFVAHAVDVATGVSTDLALASFNQVLGDGVIALNVPEIGQGARDLNGDGDTNDAVVHVFDAKAQNRINLGFAAGGVLRASGKRITFGVDEAGQGGSDLNGDGDARDFVAHLFDAAPQPPQPPPSFVLGSGRVGSFDISVAAFSTPGGPRGTVSVRTDPRVLHVSRVTCLRTVGDRVLVGGVIIHSSNPAVVGHTSLVAIRDGKAGAPDAVGSAFSSSGLDTCPVFALGLNPVTLGGFVVGPGAG